MEVNRNFRFSNSRFENRLRTIKENEFLDITPAPEELEVWKQQIRPRQKDREIATRGSNQTPVKNP